ncbi:MAG: hypothetical protein CO162_06575 [bacterium (Candidatus Ratteibacteria) CG_4_9_14_3_um_filter_41_21]|uniref:HEPN domain-containing protein n=2 Tax=Candidatus Ratteibacteria TaxID=2979319 RepID=A0A2M7E9W5_9BACT|nr:MAG: hypothetical protein COS11_01685 [bacterium (Candidatus Ratteibacteria) CG01_land_8_20_14_3_00_40_19]PJA61391.1 MAG: hypothetical protein CO162_06575 [bacterium (Candidatus Ratteibacteria) CG_4_9_14_3_um_filter_41_21]
MKYEDEIEYWLKAAAHDLEVSEILFEEGKYDWCLFIAHLLFINSAIKNLPRNIFAG